MMKALFAPVLMLSLFAAVSASASDLPEIKGPRMRVYRLTDDETGATDRTQGVDFNVEGKRNHQVVLVTDQGAKIESERRYLITAAQFDACGTVFYFGQSESGWMTVTDNTIQSPLCEPHELDVVVREYTDENGLRTYVGYRN
jgi:hypothetical protein